ncbi:MAG: fatty acid desaturase [Gammaproteobacteria bacterium]|nr:fatty acid desaturase [Gammaproteobacteria bacterium]
MPKLFKYREDRIPVFIISLLFALDIVAYFLLDNIWLLVAYWLIMIWPKGIICAWNHHHQHTPTFKYAVLNRLLEQMYALQTGATSKLWVLHHVLGHHHNYLEQEKDESRWKRKSGKDMGRLEYSLNVAITAYYRGYQVGKKHPRPLKVFLVGTAVTLLLLTMMFWYHPMPTLFVFILPMMASLLFTAWVTYGHHSGLDVDNDFEASYNIMSPIYNLLTGNLGYHTAHHHKQGLHWSRLPELHEKIKENIPQRLFLTEHLGSKLLK